MNEIDKKDNPNRRGNGIYAQSAQNKNRLFGSPSYFRYENQ